MLASKGANGATDKKPAGDASSKEKLKEKLKEKELTCFLKKHVNFFLQLFPSSFSYENDKKMKEKVEGKIFSPATFSFIFSGQLFMPTFLQNPDENLRNPEKDEGEKLAGK